MIFATREYYEPELAFLGRFCSRGAVVADAGASCGIYTVAAAKLVGDSGRVLAFEPGAESFGVLIRNIELNGLRNVRALRYALYRQEGAARLYHHPHGPVSYTLGAEPGWDGEFEEVATTTLDKILAEADPKRIDLVKLDVEGAEEPVLRGATRALSVFHPTIIFEVNPEAAARLALSANGAWNLLESLGYSFHRLDNEGNLARLETPPYGGNVLAIHPGKTS